MKYKPRENFLVYGSPAIEEDEIQEVVEVLRSGWIGTGPRVNLFEESFSRYKNTSSSTAVSSCTAALHLSLLAANLQQGDEVITTAMTFCATINAIIHAGGKPVLVDIDPVTKNINPELIEKVITKKTKIILPVHYAGYPCDMDKITQIASKYNLTIIEDCAHAIETQYKGQHVGTFGDFGCFSFYVTKNLVTAEGGMVITGNLNKAGRIRVLALHGMSKDAWKRFGDDGYKHYEVTEAGYKYNMTDIQAALGINQLKRIDDNWLKRKSIWERYQRDLHNLPVELPAEPCSDIKHAYHLFPITINEKNALMTRDSFMQEMADRNIGVGVHYLSIPEHRYYKDNYGWKTSDYPVSENYGRSTVSLPLSAKLTEADVTDVINALHDIFSNSNK